MYSYEDEVHCALLKGLRLRSNKIKFIPTASPSFYFSIERETTMPLQKTAIKSGRIKYNQLGDRCSNFPTLKLALSNAKLPIIPTKR